MRNRTDQLRTLNDPQRIQVELENGRPKTVSQEPRGARSIEVVLESWRIDDEWWRQPISRRCFEVVLESGGRVVVFEDQLTGAWWMQKP